jgi:hypothetical protein
MDQENATAVELKQSLSFIPTLNAQMNKRPLFGKNQLCKYLKNESSGNWNTLREAFCVHKTIFCTIFRDESCWFLKDRRDCVICEFGTEV